MSFAESVENNINILARASGFLKASFIIIPFALLLQIIGFSTRNWLDGDGNQGLWIYCGKNSVYKCCSTIEFHVNQIDSDIPEFINATRVFQCFGLIGAIGAAFLIIICIFISSDRGKKFAKRITMVTSFVTAFVIVLGIIIYGGRYRYESLTSKLSLSYSYVFCTIAGVVFFVPGILIAIEEFVKNDSIAPVSENSNSQPEPSAPPPEPEMTPVRNIQQAPNVTTPYTSGHENQPNECAVCFDRPKEFAFIPCGHLACCESCSNELKNTTKRCPICNGNISSTQRVFQT